MATILVLCALNPKKLALGVKHALNIAPPSFKVGN